MATFGTVTSPFANVLFDPMRVDQAVQGAQRNRLMMDNARQDQEYQTFDRERQEVARASASLLSLPPEQRPQAYAAAVRDLQARGLATRAPQQYPGDAQVEALARQGLTPEQSFSLTEKRRQSEALLGALGLGASPAAATPGIMPASMSVPSAPAAPMAPGAAPTPPPGMYGRNAPAAAARDAVLDAPPEVLAQRSATTAAQSGLPANVPYRGATAASEGGDWDAGIPQPTGAVPALSGGQAPQAPPVRAQPPAAPAGPALMPNGLTREQAALITVTAQSNPAAAAAQIAQFRQQNLTQQDRSADNARADAGLQLQRDAAARAEAAARRQEAAAGIPAGYRRAANGNLEPIPGGPADKPADAQATEAERKAASYLERMQGAEDMLQGMVRGGYDPGNLRDRVAGSTPLVGNFLTSERGQQYLNAASEWARAKLRLESGAVIGDAEAQQEARTYFPMPGDSPETIAQKERLRQTAVSAIRRQAGRAVPQGVQGPTPGSTAEPPARTAAPSRAPAPGAVEDGYRFRGGDPSSPSSWERVQ